jgi:large repetitive protein
MSVFHGASVCTFETESRVKKSRSVIAIVVFAVLAAAATAPLLAGKAPDVSFADTLTANFGATINFSLERGPQQIAGVACRLSNQTGATTTVSCGAQTATAKKSTTFSNTLSGLNAGNYTYAVTVTLTDGKRMTGETQFTIQAVRADCTVTPYTVTYDGQPHTATGSCTGVGGVALPASNLSLNATTHTNAGTYNNDAWSFSDPNGNYTNPGGTVNDVIAQHGQTVTFGAAPADPTVGGSYTPSATATSGLPVSFSIDSATAANCSISSNGVVSFLAAGNCWVGAQQAGNTNWSAAPVASQELLIAAAPDPSPEPHVDVNRYYDLQSPPLPPDSAALQCRPQSVLAGGCALNPLDGSIDNYFDARRSGIPADPNLYDFHWELHEPPGLSSVLYTSSGITGYNSPVLHIRPSSLPALQGTPAGQDVLWRVALTITSKSGSHASTQVFFRFDYQQSILTLTTYTYCQLIGHIDDVLCTSEAINGLPATPEGPGRQTITLGPGPVNPQVGGSWTPTATASSGLPVTLSVSSDTSFWCSITGGVVTFLRSGPCLVNAEQLGNATWGSAIEQWFFIIP